MIPALVAASPPRRRRRGTGTIETTRDGRFLARAPITRESIGTCDTEAEAAELLDGWLAELADKTIQPVAGKTLRGFGGDWLDRRELAGYRGIRTDRNRWRLHVEAAPFIDWTLRAITRAAVLDWLDAMQAKRAAKGRGHSTVSKRRLSRTSIQNTLNLLRVCLASAVERRLIAENPAEGVRLERRSLVTEDPWTWLSVEEQDALDKLPEVDRLIARFAIGTGLRQGEQWNLERRDLHITGPDPRVVVRFGAPGLPPKNGKIRRVPLFGVGLDAARRWVALLPTYAPENPHGLAFPTRRGYRRQKGKAPRGWAKQLLAAGIARRVRWHDLRHTCASSLVSGVWGRHWTLEEVKGLLGHASITTTERYAHLAPDALRAAATATPSIGDTPAVRQGEKSYSGSSARNDKAPPRRLERPTNGLGSPSTSEAARGVGGPRRRTAGVSPDLAARAGEALVALGAGEARGWHLAIEVLTEVAAAGQAARKAVG